MVTEMIATALRATTRATATIMVTTTFSRLPMPRTTLKSNGLPTTPPMEETHTPHMVDTRITWPTATTTTVPKRRLLLPLLLRPLLLLQAVRPRMVLWPLPPRPLRLARLLEATAP
ncbi:hypothetical protein BS50DRAFT_91589 [Corynespora cassiicola Philippines]|uniref:Uncharacterized protein n=1 Tax=Corynespora cassiicola Philippines TaxID=1448308 RepID=A0A2T2NEK8_CORCC|nr:hypothetical protein BS50DRAFT_91589 [Corynespora cassiicola Philippines]